MKKQIILDYEEYKNLLEQIEFLQKFVAKYYEKIETEEEKLEIHRYMQRYSNWL